MSETDLLDAATNRVLRMIRQMKDSRRLTENSRPEYVFKIFDPETGLFSSGGIHPKFNKVGKVWPRFSSLKGHLKCFYSHRRSLDRRTLEGNSAYPCYIDDCSICTEKYNRCVLVVFALDPRRAVGSLQEMAFRKDRLKKLLYSSED